LAKSSPTFWASSVTVLKLPKVINRPLGEDSPNLVTLAITNWGKTRAARWFILRPKIPIWQSWKKLGVTSLGLVADAFYDSLEFSPL
jgi:hypothetical protein